MGSVVQTVGESIIAVAAIVFFIWLCIPSTASGKDDSVIDASDAGQIGALIGMTGGSISDAAVARYALQRFEQEHGRKATVKEMAIVASMMRTMK